MEIELRLIRSNTFLSSLPIELINELEQFRLSELRDKSKIFLKRAWIKEEIEDHKDEGLVYKNLDTNEEKAKFDEKLTLDNDIMNIENNIDYLLKFWFSHVGTGNLIKMINDKHVRCLASEYDDDWSVLLKLKSGVYIYMSHSYGSGSKYCCHKLYVTISQSLDRL